MIKPGICQVAVPSPLRRTFDYLLPAHIAAPGVGARVLVPFGSRKVVGFVVRLASESSVSKNRLKALITVLDDEPLIPEDLFQFYQWVAGYYQHPIGDALLAMFPSVLRSGKPLPDDREVVLQLTTNGKGLPTTALSRAPKQQQLLNLLQKKVVLTAEQLMSESISRAIVRELIGKGLVEECKKKEAALITDLPLLAEQHLMLNAEQKAAVKSVGSDVFNCYLLQGETGSGKTEVYLQLIEAVINTGKQVLVLIPEISLTPQTLARFKQRFNCPIALMHSGLTDKERFSAWQQTRSGQAPILIGTRSSVFTPFMALGLIIIDEEHDSSFKQQDGFHYSARDLAVARAKREGVPILLGSATPSLESLHNCNKGRYKKLILNERHGGATKPKWILQDIRKQQLQSGFSGDVIDAMRTSLVEGDQVLVFINRRGYAPRLSCNDCGWIAQCSECDARYTVHQRQRKLVCHHCEQVQAIPHSCPACSSKHLSLSGQGTERIEETLEVLFPDYPVYRVDRDTTRRKQAMSQLVDKVNQHHPCILVGTQMLAKGHHFPNVTLVAMLDVDSGLFSPDFRAAEKMGQLITQVAGRCGRGRKPGRVIIQSHYCDHPVLTTLCYSGYATFSEALLREREITAMPPYRHLAIIRAEAKTPEQAEGFLNRLREIAQQTLPITPALSYTGPLASAMERKRGLFRYQLAILANDRKVLHRLLLQLANSAQSIIEKRGIKWRIDVDPVESI